MNLDVRLVHRIALATAVPLVMLLALASYDILGKWQERRQLDVLGPYADTVGAISDLVHQLQIERGLSSIFATSKGETMRAELAAQRGQTDRRRKTIAQHFTGLNAIAPAELGKAIEAATQALGLIDPLRSQIDDLRITAATSTASYTSTITNQLAVAREIAKASGQGDVAMSISVVVNFADGKERAGQERAVGAGGQITAGKFDPSAYTRMLSLASAQEVYLNAFKGSASPKQREFFEKAIADAPTASIERMRETIARGGLAGDLNGLNAGVWFKETTERINALKKVEDLLVSDLSNLSAAKASDARIGLLVLSGVLAGGLLASLIFVVMMARSITTPISRINEVMGELAGGKTDLRLPEASRLDEVGQMARSVLVFRDAAIEKARVERDAEIARVQAEAEHRRVQEEAIAQERALVTKSIGAGMARLAERDLSFRLVDDLPAAYTQLQSDFNTAMGALEAALQDILASAETMALSTKEVTTSADDLAKRTEQQASSLEQTAAALDEITASGKKAAEGAEHARNVVSSARSDASNAEDVVRKTVSAIGEIDKSAQQINQIISVIDEIAFQTNLLALNAGVEAARAGEAGRGFAVVASEVRALAQRSATAAKEIKGLISTSSVQVAEGVALVAQTGKALERIMEQVSDINKVVSDIAHGAQEQATGLSQINSAINQMDRMTQSNAAMVEETTAASHSLAQEAQQLADVVGGFRLSQKRSHSGQSSPVPAKGTAKPQAAPARTFAGKAKSVAAA